MIVKMLTQECGPDGSFGIGELRTVSDEHGYMLVDTKHAELVSLSKPKVAERLEAERLEAERLEAERRKQADAAQTRKPARR